MPGGRGCERVHHRDAGKGGARLPGVRLGRQGLRRLRRATLVRRANRQPVRAVLADGEGRRIAGPAPGAPSRAHETCRHSCRAEVGSPGQARPGEHHRTGPLPRGSTASRAGLRATTRRGLRAKAVAFARGRVPKGPGQTRCSGAVPIAAGPESWVKPVAFRTGGLLRFPSVLTMPRRDASGASP